MITRSSCFARLTIFVYSFFFRLLRFWSLLFSLSFLYSTCMYMFYIEGKYIYCGLYLMNIYGGTPRWSRSWSSSSSLSSSAASAVVNSWPFCRWGTWCWNIIHIWMGLSCNSVSQCQCSCVSLFLLLILLQPLFNQVLIPTAQGWHSQRQLLSATEKLVHASHYLTMNLE